MRTFFIVFLPWIALLSLCVLLGVAILVATIRWSRCFVVRRRSISAKQRAIAAQAEALCAYTDRVNAVVYAILANKWGRLPTGEYQFVMSRETAEALIALRFDNQ